MAVSFMIALEDTPEIYDHSFDHVLGGRAARIRERILDYVTPGMKVLDIGCGPGLFALEASKKGALVDAIDADKDMIAFAKTRDPEGGDLPNFIHQDILRLGEEQDKAGSESTNVQDKYDLIVSTFLLSELKPSERYLLMRIIRSHLKKDGIFAVASETLPLGRSDRRIFWRNRRKAEKESGRRLPPPVVNLEQIISGSGLEVELSEMYGPEITFIVGRKGEHAPSNPHRFPERAFHGVKARGRIWYNHLTGSWRGITVQPGLYRAGAPDADSPVIVTANYELTYYTVMRTLARDGVDAWVLVCDTDGINVWCAARGTHFDSDDLVHMIRLTGLNEVVNHRELILPQLSAAGMDPREIKERTGFRVRYGPVRIKDLSQWLQLGKPRPKPREMSTVTFNLRERMEMTVAHIPFLFAVLLWKPLAVLLVGLLAANSFFYIFLQDLFLLTFEPSISLLFLLFQFVFALLANALLLGILFPILPSRENSFLRRGAGFAVLTVPAALLTLLFLGAPWTVVVNWVAVQFILSITLTMDFAGMTSVSDPKSIRAEYPYMLLTLILGAAFLVAFNVLVFLFGW